MSIPRRTLVERFAAHLAHLLNTASTKNTVEVQTFRIYSGVTTMLAGRGHAGILYRDVLLGFRLAADRSPEQVAATYIDTVLDRRMMLARAEPKHCAHLLFEMLCRRGTSPEWPNSRLERSVVSSPGGTGASADFGAVSDRLARLDLSISPGNPAKSMREKKGALYLTAGGATAEVQDELSALKAINCSPSQQRVLADGAEFNRLCSQTIKVVEAADAHYAALLRIGLFPADWADTVNVNLAKSISASVADIRSAGRDLNDEAAWRTVFEKRRLPGVDNFDSFWGSELGRALRFPVKHEAIPPVDGRSIDDVADVSNEEDDVDLCDDVAFTQHLEAAQADSVLDEIDTFVMRSVYCGAQFVGLRKQAGVAARLKQNGWTVEQYVDDLRDRLLKWSQIRNQ
jgi:hypothetical protein